MLIAIYSKVLKPENWVVYEKLFNYLDKKNIQYCLNQSLNDEILANHKRISPARIYNENEQLGSDIKLLICLGGDGTILQGVLLSMAEEIPILGINLGQLGFMAEVSIDQMEDVLDMMYVENYVVDKRSIIELNTSNNVFEGQNFALNEFTISKRDTSSLIKIKVFLNGELLNIYWADGLIVSTPTGSTGYNLSCGGPIVFPNASNFVITPIAPHHLNIRPVVVPDNYIISFAVEGRAENILCSLDSRSCVIPINTELAVKKHHKMASLARMPETNFLQILHSKLMWGWDNRNKVF